jgi:hypothetical protein
MMRGWATGHIEEDEEVEVGVVEDAVGEIKVIEGDDSEVKKGRDKCTR